MVRAGTDLEHEGHTVQELHRAWGQRLRAARIAAGHTQVTLAAAAGVTQSTVSDYERGEAAPGDGIRIALAEACGTTAGELFPYDAVPAPEPVPCPSCDGSGSGPLGADTCGTCRGEGALEAEVPA